MTPEQNERNRAAKLGHWKDPAYRAKCVAAHLGKKQTAQTRARRGASLKSAWANYSAEAKAARVDLNRGRAFINDGVAMRFVFLDGAPPAGWALGMIKRAA